VEDGQRQRLDEISTKIDTQTAQLQTMDAKLDRLGARLDKLAIQARGRVHGVGERAVGCMVLGVRG